MVLQAPVVQGLSLDELSIGQDGLAAAVVDVGRGEVAQALVGTAVVAVAMTFARTSSGVRFQT
jgi:hypothetical protein